MCGGGGGGGKGAGTVVTVGYIIQYHSVICTDIEVCRKCVLYLFVYV